MINAPANVCVTDGYLKWSGVDCADGYNLHVGDQFFRTVHGNKYPVDPTLDWSVSAFVKDPNPVNPNNVQAFHTSRTPAITERYTPTGALRWSEDFQDISTEHWTSEFDWGRMLTINNEDQFYVAQLEGQMIGYNPINYDHAEQAINLKAVRQTYNGLSWLSGKLCTRDARQLEGEFYVSVVARCDFSKGIWPAIWLFTANYGVPQSEIDIMEQPGISRFTAYHNYHYLDSNGRVSNEQTTEVDTTQYHEYGCLRKAGKIIIMIDGMPVHTITENVLLEDMNLILNLAMGGDFAGDIPPELQEANFYIRSVKVFDL